MCSCSIFYQPQANKTHDGKVTSLNFCYALYEQCATPRRKMTECRALSIQAVSDDCLSVNIVGNVDIGFLDFFDVHVLEGHDAHGLDETAGTVDIPYPCVSQLHIEIHVLTSGTHVEIDLIRQVEATLSLHHIGEQLDDVTVFPIQREFGVGFVIVEILGTCLLYTSPSPRDRG